MSRRSERKDRAEVTEKVGRAAEDMREKGTDLETAASEVQTIRDTLASLEFGGTAEGADAVEMAVRGAEDVTTEVFDREDRELEDIHGEAEGFQGELEEDSDTTRADLDRLSEASGKVDTQETVAELVKAKDAALRDVDFLLEHISRAREAREESERARQEYQQKVHGSQGA